MSDLILNIAGFHILIKFSEVEFTRKIRMPEYIKWRYNDFLYSSKKTNIDFTIKFIHAQEMRSLFSSNKKRFFINLYDVKSGNVLITFYHISLFQFDVILTYILQKLLTRKEGFILHTSAVSIKGKAFCFMGRSGAGKSTVVNLLSDIYKPLSDDSGIIKKQGDNYYFYQMPLSDKNIEIKKSSNAVPLGRIYFLHKGNILKARKITNKEKIIKKISLQLYSEKDNIEKQIVSLGELINSQDTFFDLTFSRDKKEVISFFQNNETKI